MSTRSTLARVALAAAVVATTASDQWPDRSTIDSMTPADPIAAGHPVGPAPTAFVPTVISPIRAPVVSDCTPQNLRASLRPQGPLPAPTQLPARSTMARIASRGYLIAGVGEDTYPFAVRGEDMKPEGFDVDLARDIAEAIFGNREQVVFRPAFTAMRFDGLTSGQLDLVLAANTITCKRREQVEFSTVYYEAGQRVLVNRGSAVTGMAGLGGKKVCAARGTTSLGKILSDPAKPIPVGAATTTDCLMLLQLGTVDAVSTDDTLLAGMAEQDPRTEVVGPQLTQEPYGVVINKNAPDLVRFVNAVLERRVADGRWRASYERWLAPLGPPPPPPVPQYRD